MSGVVATRAGGADASAGAVYRAAIDATAALIARRARNFRNLVITVAALGLASVAWAAVGRAPSALGALLLVVPVCGGFFLADARLLNDWRSALIARWAARDLDLAAFRHAMRAHPALPTETMEAMLATLPSAGDLVAEQRVGVPNRRAIAALADARQRERADALGLRTAASGIAALVLVAALWTREWMPLLGLGTLALLPMLGAALRRRRQRARDAAIAACRDEAAFDDADHARLVADLP